MSAAACHHLPQPLPAVTATASRKNVSLSSSSRINYKFCSLLLIADVLILFSDCLLAELVVDSGYPVKSSDSFRGAEQAHQEHQEQGGQKGQHHPQLHGCLQSSVGQVEAHHCGDGKEDSKEAFKQGSDESWINGYTDLPITAFKS